MRRLAGLLLLGGVLAAQTPTIATKMAGNRPIPGYLPLYLDEKAGKLWMEIGNWTRQVLYYPSLASGVGSNDIGLDRGQLGGEKLVRWERHGPRVLLVHVNTQFISTSTDRAERRSVSDSFAESVLWGFDVAAEEGGRVLVDATPFFLRDAHGVIDRLREAGQGAFRVDPSRSALYEPRTRNFPRNTEVEAVLTFTGDSPGNWVRSVTPSAQSITVRQHHSFVELPEQPYQARAFDPRSGFFPGTTFVDYSTPLGEPMTKRFIARHRLTKDKPLIYYLDPGTPEPVRSALLQGARWWKEAFQAAGFDYDVQMLPADADPLDIRYNVIQWVHRSSRGWSYGTSVTDPRSGEILKGHVTLGSLRVRQDYLIAEGLLAPYEAGKSVPAEMEKMALARLRQLAAHEVGHTLGLTHNFAASVSDRSSVMDYPHPLVFANGAAVPDLSKAYAEGIGDFDKLAIRWGYADDDNALAAMRARGYRFISDTDARAPGGAHPQAHLWDNAANAAAELDRVMQVRGAALARFGENAIRTGTPMSNLEDVLVPVYLAHRYQVEAAAKVLGGLDYNYAVRGDGQLVAKLVPGLEQRRALEALLRTISAEALTLPEPLLSRLPPRAYGSPRTRESFRSRTGITFDPVAAAESAANLTLGLLLHPERAARLVQHEARDASLPGLAAVIEAVLSATWKAPRRRGLTAEVQRTVETVAAYHLMVLAASETAPAQVRAIADSKLASLARLLSATPADPHRRYSADVIRRFREDPKQLPLPKPLEAPPGQPI